MSKPKERAFGDIPPWAKLGPVRKGNYSYRAELHCSIKTGERHGAHPTLKRDSPELAAWMKYFDDHLGGRPLCFRMLLDGSVAEMTLPERFPEWFDPTFDPKKETYQGEGFI